MTISYGPESNFGFDELFFSRTNSKGVIESGNSVFQRVSLYEWGELLNKPHNLIRHPAMPRGVFHLLWDTILAGKHIGAYVINQAKDHSHYWVYALVSPVQGGFVSVRLKPSSPIFEIVKDKYAELLEIEKTKKLTPKESHEVLLKTIQGLNFRNYEHFMTEALTQELEYRQKSLGLPPIKIISQLREVMKLGTQLQKKCEEIFSAYQKSSLIPLNLEVQAAKIGQEAASIAVISSQYDGLARQIKEEIKKFMGAGSLVQERVGLCQFDICNSLLQRELFDFFKNEDRPSPIKKDVEMKYLEGLGRAGIKNAKGSLAAVDVKFKEFKAVYEQVKRLASGLDIVSISGKIEVAKIKQSSSELLGLLGDLANFKTSLKGSLKQIDNIGSELISQTMEMDSRLT